MPKVDLGGITTPEIQPPPYQLSPQQEAVIAFVKSGSGSATLEAVAGSGKTSTLVEVCKHIQGQGTAAFTAFNKKIADEIGRKLLDAGVNKSVRSSTMHSYGFSAWRRVAPKVTVEGEKLFQVMDALDIPKNLRGITRSLVSLLKQHVVHPDQPSFWTICEKLIEHHDLGDRLTIGDDYTSKDQQEDLILQTIEHAEAVISESMSRDHDIIDFDDMIFSPLIHDSTFWTNDWVLIDEAQDTNRARRMLAERMLKSGGRLIAVGDPHQAIYGFTGADADALELIVDQFECQRFPLSVSFRCAQAIVEHAQQWVSHIEAAPSAPEGIVSFIDKSDFMKLTPARSDAIICRNTRPLIELAFHFLRQQIPAHVEGRDIGQSLLSLVNKWRRVRTVLDLRVKLDEYLRDEIYRLMQAGKEAKIAQIQDRIESLQVIMDTLPHDAQVEEVGALINRIFKDTDGKPVQSITLSTVHKAKGREWDRVYLWGRNKMMPSPFAKQTWQIQQEHNLIYVAVTRAKSELIEVDV